MTEFHATSIKDFILKDPNNIKSVEKTENKAYYEYEVVMANHNDLIVRKTSKTDTEKGTKINQVKTLVVVPLNRQITFVDEKTGEHTPVTEASLAAFTKEMPHIDNYWITTFPTTPTTCGNLINFIKNYPESLKEIFKLNLVYFPECEGKDNFPSVRNSKFIESNVSKYKKVFEYMDTLNSTERMKQIMLPLIFNSGWRSGVSSDKLAQQFETNNISEMREILEGRGRHATVQGYYYRNYGDNVSNADNKSNIDLIMDKWGIEGARKYITLLANVNIGSNVTVYYLVNAFEKAEEFCEYVTDICLDEEYEDIGEFLGDYNRYYEYSMLGIGQVPNKKPHNLATLAHKYMRIENRTRQERENKSLNNIFEACHLFEYQKGSPLYKAHNKEIGSDYAIIAPKSVDDLHKEGNDMRHCVGGYGPRIAQNQALVFFVRKPDNLEHCFVTIDVDHEFGVIRQIRAKMNAEAPKDVREFVDRWLRVVAPNLEEVMRSVYRGTGCYDKNIWKVTKEGEEA